MIHLLCGAPGPFATWCGYVLCALLERGGRRVAAEPVARLDEIASAALRSGADDLVCLATRTDEAFAQALAGAARGPVLVDVDPLAMMAAALEAGAEPPGEAFRGVLATAVALGEAGAHPGALRLTPEGCAADPAGATAALAAQAGLPPDPARDAAVAGAADGLLAAAQAGAPDAAQVEETLAGRIGDPGVARAMTAALRAYGEIACGRPTVVTARPELFLTGVAPHEPIREPLDVTGAARFLFIGGHLPLPAGDWEAHVLLDLSAAATEGIYAVDILGVLHEQAAILGHQILTMAAPGAHRIVVTFRSFGATRLIVARLRSDKAMFDGRVTLREVRFLPRALALAS